MKPYFQKLAFVAIALMGVTSLAHAEYYQYYSCDLVWVQTGLLYGQGYIETLCYQL